VQLESKKEQLIAVEVAGSSSDRAGTLCRHSCRGPPGIRVRFCQYRYDMSSEHQRRRNISLGYAVQFIGSSVGVGLGIQGIYKGDAARWLGIILVILGLASAIKAAIVISAASAPPTRSRSSNRWIVQILGARDVLGLLWMLVFVALIVLAIPQLVLNSRVPINYRSGYDGLDPVHAACTSNSTAPGVVKATGRLSVIQGDRAYSVGTLQLAYSNDCGTYWPRVVFAGPRAVASLQHDIIDLVVTRVVDNTTASYSEEIEGYGHVAYGNMLGGGACIDVSAAILSRHSKTLGVASASSC